MLERITVAPPGRVVAIARNLEPRTLGEGLRLLMWRAGVTRDKLAEAAELGAATLTGYLHDHTQPGYASMRRLCNALAELLAVDPAELWAELGELQDAHLAARREVLDAELEAGAAPPPPAGIGGEEG